MFPTRKLGCSWPFVAVIASVVALVSVVHMFLFPVLPLFDNFGAPQAKNSSALVNYSTGVGDWKKERQHPADLHGAVVYCGAPWKAKIGQWLSSCGTIAKEVKLNEVLGGKDCQNSCSSQGVCNHELRQCRCYHGYTGQYLLRMLSSTRILEHNNDKGISNF